MLKSLRHLLWILLPFGISHLFIVYTRNKLYDWLILKTKRLPKPVISIGNLQMGGTGKTPLTISILRMLQNEGLKVGVLSRGYKRESNEEIVILKPNAEQEKNIYETVGDEPALILSRLRGSLLGIGADRFMMGKRMLEQHPADLFLLDDGLQHRKLHRDVNICLIDMTRWKSHPFLFPFSYLRDCKSSLKRCQAVILTKIGDRREKAQRIEQKIRRRHNIPVFEGDLVPQAFINIRDGSEVRLSEMKGEGAVAFCGIANPDHFSTMLKKIGVDLVWENNFSDHHDYSLEDIRDLTRTIVEKGVKTAITTEKDAVKVKDLIDQNNLAEVEIFFLKVEFAVKEKKKLFQLIQELLPPKYFN